MGLKVSFKFLPCLQSKNHRDRRIAKIMADFLCAFHELSVVHSTSISFTISIRIFKDFFMLIVVEYKYTFEKILRNYETIFLVDIYFAIYLTIRIFTEALTMPML